MIKSPQVKYLRRIRFDRVPNVQSGGCKPYFTVYKVNGLINDKKFDSQNDMEKVRFYNVLEGEIDFFLDIEVPLCGSILVVFKHRGMMAD